MDKKKKIWFDRDGSKIFAGMVLIMFSMGIYGFLNRTPSNPFEIFLLILLFGSPFFFTHLYPLRADEHKIIMAPDHPWMFFRRALYFSEIKEIRITRGRRWDEKSRKAPYAVVRVLDKNGIKYRNMIWRASAKGLKAFLAEHGGFEVKDSS